MAYFDAFPQGIYANTQVVDISRRVALRRSLVADSRVYLPYELRSGERADQVAQHYYGDTENVWMVYMSANTIDPYWHWYMDQNSFDDHVVKKYGSQELAIQATDCWQLDWASDETEMTVGGYDALEPQLKKYWEAVYGVGSQIIAYTRRQEDWQVTTNMVVRLEIEPSGNTQFKPGDYVTVYQADTTRDGSCEVAWANSSVVKVVHVQANLEAGYVVTADSGANASVTEREYVSNTIPVDERPYWHRVSKYDAEYDRNEQRKFVRLVDRKYTTQMGMELKDKLAQEPPA